MSDPSSSHYGGVAMMRNIRSSPAASRAYGGTTALTMASQQGHTTPLTLRGSDRMGEGSWDGGATSSSTPQTYNNNATLRPLQHIAHPNSPHTLHNRPMTDFSALSPESQSGELQFESEYLRALFRNERTQLSPESAAVLGLGGAGTFTEHGSHRPLPKEQQGLRGSPVGYSVLSGSSSVPDSGTPPLRRVSSLQTGASGSGERWKKGTRPIRPFNDGADKENARPEMLADSGAQVQSTPSFRPPLHPRTLSKEFLNVETSVPLFKREGMLSEPAEGAPTPSNQKTMTPANATVQRSATATRWRRVGRLGLGPAKRSRPEDEPPVQEAEAELEDAPEKLVEASKDDNDLQHRVESLSLVDEPDLDVERGRRFPQLPVSAGDIEASQTTDAEGSATRKRWRGLGVPAGPSPGETTLKSDSATKEPVSSRTSRAGHSRQASQEWTVRPAPTLPIQVPTIPPMPTPLPQKATSGLLQQAEHDLAHLNFIPNASVPVSAPLSAPSELDEVAKVARNSVSATAPLSQAPQQFEGVTAGSTMGAPPPPSQPPPPLPAKAGKGNVLVNGRAFTRLDVVGRGGSSKVYKVMAPNNRIFALKKVSFDKADQSAVAGYINEIGLLKRLSGNDRIIRLYDAEVSHEKGYLLMLMECGEIDLAHLLQKQAGKAINLNFIRMYWEQMLQAVHAIHEERIVHSDLKPANFLLVEGSLKLIDFGIAKAISNDTTNIHRDQQVGTVNYMSPEAINDTNVGMPGNTGKRLMKLGRPSDVWSLGCILYQMVFGRPPFAALSMYQKIQVIPDPNYKINFPSSARPSPPAAGTGITAAPTEEELDRLSVDVEPDLLRTMKSCLERDGKARMTIPELLQDPFLRPGRRNSTMVAPKLEGKVNLDQDGIASIVSQVLAFAKARRHELISREDAEMLSKTLYSRLKESALEH